MMIIFGISVLLSFFAMLMTGMAEAQEFAELGIKAETVAEGLVVPWAISFLPDGRIFVTERDGHLRVIEDGILKEAPVLTLSVGRVEGGLLGMALDPQFESNHHVYLYYTYSELLSTYNRVSRFTESNNALSEEVILIDKIPGAAIHDGGRIKFGPDGKLYVATGDASNASLSQDVDSLAGKILRINPDGTIPADNPFENSPVYSYGHRNPQGFDWDPATGVLVATEHGPSGERGFAHDEINIVKPGKNYGWPEIVGDESDIKYASPAFHTGRVAWAPSGASFYSNDKMPIFDGKFLVATLRGTHLHVFEIDTSGGKIISETTLFAGTFGRLRDVSVGPDGYLYLLTSNRDGRGSPAANDDRIIRLTPIAGPSNISPVDAHPCSNGLEPVTKASNGKTACVKPETKIKLIHRGWAKSD